MATKDTSDVLVSTSWVDSHRNDVNTRIVEVDVDTTSYQDGHIPGAIGWNWQTELCDTLRRDVIPRPQLEQLLSRSGISNDSTVVLYGDNNNWFACWAFWQLKMYGHQDLRIMDGGRKKWITEGRAITREQPSVAKTNYVAAGPDTSIRATLSSTMESYNDRAHTALVDVRSADEYTGRILAPPGLPETCQRGGHIPNARNIPWGSNVRDDGTFKAPAELRMMYENLGVTPDKNVIAYCRIGERSSLTWFTLKYLLDYPNVRNYDGSWTEWGNLVNAPIEREPALA